MFPDADELVEDIATVTEIHCSKENWRPVSGGDINQAWQLRSEDGTRWFLKTNRADRASMFATEYAALDAISATETVRVPVAVAYSATVSRAWLLLEWLEFGRPDEHTSAKLGSGLAAMHRTTHEQFGWSDDNFIGSTPQQNGWSDDWIAFYRDRRLRSQLDLAERKGASGGVLDAGRRLLEELGAFFTGYQPVPSLLHGDLWGGNYAPLLDGSPVIYDPASYYGDREADIAMTRLFGGFDERFYRAYNEAWPLDEGSDERQELYNLYHVLNHYNLFGGGYLSQADAIIGRLLALVKN